MAVTLGIDIGGSTTKIVGLREDASLISALRVKADDPLTSLYGALGNFVASNHLSLQDIGKIALTGVGSSCVEGDIYGIPTVRVEEFTAVGVGGLHLAGQDRAVVVSMGTGTAFIHAVRGQEYRHLGGSGVGGGTLHGLCSRLCDVRQFGLIRKLAGQGDLKKVDLAVNTITQRGYSTLPGDVTAANFGDLSDDAGPGDLALGVINMIFQTIGTVAVFACRSCQCDTAVLTGYMTTLDQLRPCISLLTRLHGTKFIIPENAAYATAIGAALSSF